MIYLASVCSNFESKSKSIRLDDKSILRVQIYYLVTILNNQGRFVTVLSRNDHVDLFTGP